MTREEAKGELLTTLSFLRSALPLSNGIAEGLGCICTCIRGMIFFSQEEVQDIDNKMLERNLNRQSSL